MKNLENFGVQEMNAKEIRETDGGFFPLIIFVYMLLSASTVTSVFAAGVVVGTAGAVVALSQK